MARKKGQEVADTLSDFVNSAMLDDKDEFVQAITSDHRALQQDNFSMMLKCIEKWSRDYEAGNYDARNERACKASKMMMDVFE